MPRLPRIQVKGAVYYVTCQSIENQEIFKDKEDYKMYLEMVSKYKSQYKFRLYSYCLLPNRLELLIEPSDEASISEVMHDIHSLYTKYYNGKYDKKGHLFESRFRSVLVEKVHYLLEMTRHIHLAPKRFGLSGGLDHPHSSYQIYCLSAESNQPGFSMADEKSEILQFLKNKNDELTYEKYVLEGDEKEIEHLEKSLRRGQVLGGEAFISSVKKRVETLAEERKEKGRPAKPSPTILFFIGALVIAASSSSVYLYVSKSLIENKYKNLLSQKEQEFAEKTRFENQSPIALEDLEGTVWNIEMLSMASGKSGKTVADSIHFEGGQVFSVLYADKGFKATNYTLSDGQAGMKTWETVQTNPAGDVLSWRGDWQGGAMKGVVSFKPATGTAQDFSFYSAGWTYSEGTPLSMVRSAA